MTMKKSIVITVMIVVACALIFSGSAQAKEAPKEILIGCCAPMTGLHAGFGEGNVWGEKAAVEDINKQGGIYIKEYGRKLPVKLIVLDNESDPTKAMSLEESLVTRDKVHFLAPPNQPIPLQIPSATIAERYKVARVSGGTPMEPWLAVRNEASPPWEHSWTYTFAIVAPAPKGSIWDRPGYTIKDTWEGMINLFGPKTNKKAGVFASDEPDGRGWYSLFPPMLEGWGYAVAGIKRNLGLFPVDTTDFSSIIREWMDNNVEIVWGNCPGPLFGAMWRQARAMGFQPKIVYVGRAALYYEDISAWGGDLPWGIGTEIWWSPSFDPKACPGIGGTTPMSLYERWVKDTGRPLNPGIGWGYNGIQILADAIERAGSLDSEKVKKALSETDMKTISSPRVQFDENHSARMPLVFGQWFKTDKPWVWECPIVYSKHDFVKATTEPLFPVPYK